MKKRILLLLLLLPLLSLAQNTYYYYLDGTPIPNTEGLSIYDVFNLHFKRFRDYRTFYKNHGYPLNQYDINCEIICKEGSNIPLFIYGGDGYYFSKREKKILKKMLRHHIKHYMPKNIKRQYFGRYLSLYSEMLRHNSTSNIIPF